MNSHQEGMKLIISFFLLSPFPFSSLLAGSLNNVSNFLFNFRTGNLCESRPLSVNTVSQLSSEIKYPAKRHG